MEKHHGKIIERVVRRANMSLSELSKLLGVNRRSVYNWFTLSKIRPEVIYRLGQALEYDFSKEFPEFFSPEDFQTTRKPSEGVRSERQMYQAADEEFWKDKYITLLEKINKTMTVAKNISA